MLVSILARSLFFDERQTIVYLYFAVFFLCGLKQGIWTAKMDPMDTARWTRWLPCSTFMFQWSCIVSTWFSSSEDKLNIVFVSLAG